SRPRSFSDISIPETSSGRIASQVKDSLSKIQAKDWSFVTRRIEPLDTKYLNFDSFVSIASSLYQKAEKNAREFITIIRDLGFKRASIDIKSVDSFAEKVVRKTKRLIKETGNPNIRYSPNEINDLVRGTILVKNEQEGLKVVKQLGGRVADFDNYFEKPINEYKGINVDIRLSDGSLAELQIHTPETLKRAEELHKEYDEVIKKAQAVKGVKEVKSTTEISIGQRLPSQLVKSKIGLRSFIDASTPASISSLENITGSHVQDSVSRTKTLLSSILNREPRFQKYLADLDDLSAILTTVYHRAGKNVKPFADLVRTTTGINEIALDIKGVKSAIYKLLRKRGEGKWQTVDEINNILRGTILAKDEKEAMQILQKLEKAGVVEKYDNYFLRPKGEYKGINADLRLPDGSLAELQIHTKESNEIAEKIHEVYKRKQYQAVKGVKEVKSPERIDFGTRIKALSPAQLAIYKNKLAKERKLGCF
ncbi:MAG: hypothetical protein ACPLZH_00905, partial [Minisyncoccales bacterium]